MSQGFRLTGSTALHRGDRDYQQDQVLLISHARVPACVLGIVADGMGGLSGGRKASDQVMLTAQQLFERFDPNTDDPVAALKRLVHEAHIVIRLTAISAEEEPHSTLAAFMVLPGGDCHWIHSGDSRIYHFREAELVYRTTDHSLVQDLVDRGEILATDASNHPQSNVLMGCLGTEEPPPVGLHSISQLLPGDSILACSDGLWHYFSDAELGDLLERRPPEMSSEVLVEKARRRANGGGDNLGLVIVKLETLDD
ncbi:MAG: protein phosphatase 2C domain-containing protein [Pseudomonadota bacterium]